MVPAIMLLAVACGRNGPTLVPVSGRVLFQGKPLPTGSIVFTPNSDKGGEGPLARAEIQTDGSYSLRTGEAVGGCVGWHRVTVAAVAVPAEKPLEGNLPEVQSLIPPHYAVPEQSGLEGLIRPGQANIINFDLK